MFKKLIATAALISATSLVNAAVIELDQTVTVKSTNYSETVSFATFDTMMNTRVLESVTLSMVSLVNGNAALESRDAAPATITARLQAEIDLTGPLGRLLSSTIPSVTRTFMATAFDGMLDFGGTSGITYTDLGASQSTSVVLTDMPTLTFFSLPGTADFTFDAVATSFATGPGGFNSAFDTNAGAEIKLIYTYRDVTVPVAPASIALFGMFLFMVTAFKRARK